jgi:2'-5' RNA ligase
VRLFIGIEISDEVRAELARVQQRLGRCRAKVKWVPPQNIHLTMRFLGEVSEDRLESVSAAMAGAAGGGPFEFEVCGLGRFPSRGSPRLVWAGVKDGAERVCAVQAELERGVRKAGFEAERRRFTPHLTVGRVKSRAGTDELSALIEQHADRAFGRCPAAELVLIRSKLTPSGAVYSAVDRQELCLA